MEDNGSKIAHKKVSIYVPIVKILRKYVILHALQFRSTEVDNERIAPVRTLFIDSVFTSYEILYRCPSLEDEV
jgi:hypothetical protein